MRHIFLTQPKIVILSLLRKIGRSVLHSFANAAKKFLSCQKIRVDWSDGDIDFEEGFYILKHTICPAVLTENFFMDNHHDLQYLQSDAGRRAIADLHVEGIISSTSRGEIC